MLPSREELITLVRQHYPSSNALMFTSERSPETRRLDDKWEHWVSNLESWDAFRDELSRALPHHIIGETYPSMEGGPRGVIYMPQEAWAPHANWDVVGCMSLLAPVYFVYGVEWDFLDGRRQNLRARFSSPPPSMAGPARVIAETMERMLGLAPLPRELADTPVPVYAGSLEPHETTLFHALFTSAPQRIP